MRRFIPERNDVPQVTLIDMLTHGQSLRAELKSGLKTEVLDVVGNAAGMSRTEFIKTLGLTERTLARRMKQERLSQNESEAVARYAVVYDLAMEVFQWDEQAVLHWMRTPLAILAGETPNQALSSESGARDVMSVLEGIQNGVVM